MESQPKYMQQGADWKRRIAEVVARDKHAPLYHFIDPGPNCCGDPNGAIFWNGRYHLFFIFQDPASGPGDGPWKSGHCWGHASSADLVHWDYHPAALRPAPGDPDQGIFSGCAVVTKEGVPALVYHGCGAGTCVATALDDDLIHWRKNPNNPVIPEPKKEGDPGWKIYNVFDPHVWLEGDNYYAILGGKVKPDDKYDTVYLFRSGDLERWEYLHPFYEPNPQWTDAGDDCACPDFFRFDGQHALVSISHAKGARCYLGNYENEKFYPASHQYMNWPGGCCFAPETLLDDKGRRIFWAWALPQQKDPDPSGPVGVMTMPRVLTLKNGRLHVEPPAEIELLRREYRDLKNEVESSRREVSLPDAGGECLEIGMEASIGEGSRLEVKVRASADGREETVIIYDGASGELSIDASRSTLDERDWRPWPLFKSTGVEVQNTPIQRVPCPLASDEPLQLRVFVDRSIIEVFANGGLCLTQRIYPSLPDSTGLGFSIKGDVRLTRFDVWDMEKVNQVGGRE